MSNLSPLVTGHSRVLIQQTKEWGEILLGFEGRNRYEIRSESGELLGLAAEKSGGMGAWFLRNMLGRLRRASIHVCDPQGNVLGRGEKLFRWFFHRMEIYDGEQFIGAVQRKWSWVNRHIVVENANGEEVMEIVGPFLRIWTFRLQFQGQIVGHIRKKWGGLLKEAFTDADRFGVEWEEHVPAEVRRLLLLATFLIDFSYFENNQKSGGSISFGD
jgi:uncharacterized protein YxjI